MALRARKSPAPSSSAKSDRRPTARFRGDLRVSRIPSGADGPDSFSIEDPVSGSAFSFGEEEYFLCQSMDGKATPEEVIEEFSKRFGHIMSADSMRQFEDHLRSMGLVETSPSGDASIQHRQAEEGNSQFLRRADRFEGDVRWILFDPENLFATLLRAATPFRWLFRALVWSLIPGVPLALYLMLRHGESFSLAGRALTSELGYFGRMLFGLLSANLIRCVVQGVVCAHYQVPAKEFGIRLRRGLLPQFYVRKGRVKDLGRSARLRIYGVALLVRLFYIVGGTFLWFFFQNSGSTLSSSGVILAQAGLIGLCMLLLPLEATDGYRWLMTFLKLPINTMMLAIEVLKRRLTRQPLPDTLSGWVGFRYVLYGVALIVGWTFFFFVIVGGIANGLERTFPGLFGRATGYIFLVVVLVFVARWVVGRAAKHSKGSSRSLDDEEEDDDEMTMMTAGQKTQGDTWAGFFSRIWKVLVIAAGVLFLLLPFPYRPGGEIQVLPPLQQQIQAPVSGKIAEIPFEGGDGKLITRGTLVAKMISNEIENELLTLEQSRSQQLATIDKAKSELAKLVSGARNEEITGAEAKLQQTVEQMSIATQELESAKVSATYSAMVLPRMKKLFESGSIALLQYEEAKKAADIDRINVEKASKNFASLAKTRDEAQAQLDLLRSGARQEDIDSARHTVEAAQADLLRIEQQIQYTRQQQTESALLMPFDGYLVDSHLDFKKGTYLKVGDVYATAQNNSQPLVEVQLPEYDMEGVEVGAVAQVKLFAYPNSSLVGKVLSIQPAALPSSTTSAETIIRMFRVLIEVEKPPFSLKAGMTGFAKINAGFQPLGLLLARPIIRFVQIEMWSWLP